MRLGSHWFRLCVRRYISLNCAPDRHKLARKDQLKIIRGEISKTKTQKQNTITGKEENERMVNVLTEYGLALLERMSMIPSVNNKTVLEKILQSVVDTFCAYMSTRRILQGRGVADVQITDGLQTAHRAGQPAVSHIRRTWYAITGRDANVVKEIAVSVRRGARKALRILVNA